jgi:hypothetical protein
MHRWNYDATHLLDYNPNKEWDGAVGWRGADFVGVLLLLVSYWAYRFYSFANDSDMVSFEVFAKVDKLKEEKLDVEIETLSVADVVNGRKPGE